MGAASIMASIGPGPPATWNMTTKADGEEGHELDHRLDRDRR